MAGVLDRLGFSLIEVGTAWAWAQPSGKGTMPASDDG